MFFKDLCMISYMYALFDNNVSSFFGRCGSLIRGELGCHAAVLGSNSAPPQPMANSFSCLVGCHLDRDSNVGWPLREGRKVRKKYTKSGEEKYKEKFSFLKDA
jgi:hypothetical protein